MNCFHAQQRLSPYLDQQLTGAEMLEIQQHLAQCGQCAEEYHSARQVKSLLHSLSLPHTESSLEARILARLAEEERRSEMFLPPLPQFSTLPSLPISLLPPSRGRRMTASFALSCLAVFAVAAPFAPSTPVDFGAANRAALGQTAILEPMPNAGLHAVPAYSDPWTRPVSFVTADVASQSAWSSVRHASVPRDIQPPLADVGPEPLGDAAASGYVSGDVAFVGYRVR